MLGYDLRMLPADLLEHALPQAMSMGEDVGFVRHKHTLARASVLFLVVLAIFKGVTDDALDPLARVEVLLHRHFVRCSLLEASPDVDVHTFGVLADHDKVDVFRSHPFQWA